MAKTTAPTGLTITRDGWKFNFSWKQMGQYVSEKAHWTDSTMNPNYGTLRIGDPSQTSSETTWAPASYYPNANKPKLTYVGFRVSGRTANHTMSNWTYGWFNIYAPNKSQIDVELGTWPKATFKWEIPESGMTQVDVKTTGAPWFTRLILTSVLVKDSGITNGADINWDAVISGATTEFNGVTQNTTRFQDTFYTETGTFEVVEDASLLNDGHSYTRWVRILAQGPAGDSEIGYAKHVYAMPNQCTIDSYKLTRTSHGYDVQVDYTSPITAERPVDTIETEYVFTKPDAGITCPTGLTWEDGAKALATDQTGGSMFTIDDQPGDDEVLFIRVNAIYDGRTTQGVPLAVDFGKLKTPTNLSVSPNTSNYKVTVTATNAAESDIDDSFLVVRYMTQEDPNGFDLAIIPHGQTTVTGVQCPTWTTAPKFGVYAVAPADCYTTKSRGGGVTNYIVKPTMKSDLATWGGSVPEAPATVSATPTTNGTILVSWDWSWADADGAELSWADHADAWESTNEPNTYDVTKLHAASWNISGLETGIKWYVRVRLFQTVESERTYGAYSATIQVDLASAPNIPVLKIPDSDAVITEDGQVTASWIYSATDGTPQAFAEIAEVTIVNNNKVYTPIARTQTAQHVTISAQEQGWATGEQHTLACRVGSASGRASDGWSNEVTIAVAEPIACTITSTSLETVNVPSYDQEGEIVYRSVLSLVEMPMTATITGAGNYGTTTLTIERAAPYHVERPDETDYNGFTGETIFTTSQIGEAQITINRDDLIGHLDDSAAYRLIATVQDGLGQTDAQTIEFEVHWEHQAIAPTATIEMDDEHRAAILSPIAPTGAAQTDVCDIYRISADRPQLIYKGAEFGEVYVDPYPAIGEHGGHRFVTRTADGDYITAANRLAWYDTGSAQGDLLNLRCNVIDFENGQVDLTYNAELSNAWQKDFKETKYLGGSIQGDWNKAVSRTASLTVTAVAGKDFELIESMRRLADNTGICHVRTKDGSSYPADVQVNETYNYAKGAKTYEFSLSITRIDPQTLDGMTYDDWESINDLE